MMCDVRLNGLLSDLVSIPLQIHRTDNHFPVSSSNTFNNYRLISLSDTAVDVGNLIFSSLIAIYMYVCVVLQLTRNFGIDQSFRVCRALLVMKKR